MALRREFSVAACPVLFETDASTGVGVFIDRTESDVTSRIEERHRYPSMNKNGSLP